MSQAFDIASVNFADPVQAMFYEEHVIMPFPKHGTDCEACHVAGTYNVPDQTQSLPGIQSASAKVQGKTRAIGTIPAAVTGPAARACGGCHTAELVNEDDANGLVSFRQHIQQGGYIVEAGKTPLDTLSKVIDQVMAFFK
jgi:hypothetical protein